MFSKGVPGEGIVEILGHKTDTGVMAKFLEIFSPLMLNSEMGECLGKFMATFGLAGVEAQTVEGVLETFGGTYYDF